MCAEMPARKPIGHRYREEIGDPAETENSAGDEHETDHERQRGGERRVLGRAGRGQERRPPAKIGVMVESAPQDRKRLFPKKANANEPARKAKNPISGENPPSRAVAICSGIAMAARVRPATKSRVKNRGRYELRERNTGQALYVPAKRGSGEPGVFAMNSSPQRKLLAPAPPMRSRARWPFLAIEPAILHSSSRKARRWMTHTHWTPPLRCGMSLQLCTNLHSAMLDAIPYGAQGLNIPFDCC